MSHKFDYEWTLEDAAFTKDKGTVFSCFSCGGGSTMGYKLAGFDVIGCCEIDPKMMDAYITNHNPRFPFLESVADFKERDDLPQELYELDILDGSPPCSSFSMAGNREKDWGKEKKFREGQKEQVLDRLFFDFIDIAKKLQPKVVIAENVKGLLQGDAKKYVNEILIAFDDAGYFVDFKLLDASRMGVPQRRERVFFYAIRKDLYKGEFVDLFGTQPVLDLHFDEDDIIYNEIREDEQSDHIKMPPSIEKWWKLTRAGDSLKTAHPKGHFFNEYRLSIGNVLPTIRASGVPWDEIERRGLSSREVCLAGSYPIDYDFGGKRANYFIGMSVPPVMTAQIATRVYEQWLEEL